MGGCYTCKKRGNQPRKHRSHVRKSDYERKPNYPEEESEGGCAGLEETCTNSFPYPFTDFPIYILAGGSYLEGYEWKEMFPEAILIHDFEQIKINLSNLGPNGALVINATSFTSVCRDLLLNTITAAINISKIKKFHGFYIDNYFDSFPDKTTIADLTPRQSLNIASLVRVDPKLRSYWMGNFENEFRLEAQLFPQLVSYMVPHSVEPPVATYGLYIAIFFILLGFIYWLSVLVWY